LVCEKVISFKKIVYKKIGLEHKFFKRQNCDMIASSRANFLAHSIWLGGREEGMVIGWPKIYLISAGLKKRVIRWLKQGFTLFPADLKS
jgi:hypothetical protein